MREFCNKVISKVLNPAFEKATVSEFRTAYHTFVEMKRRKEYDKTKVGIAAILFAAPLPEKVWTGFHMALDDTIVDVHGNEEFILLLASDFSHHTQTDARDDLTTTAYYMPCSCQPDNDKLNVERKSGFLFRVDKKGAPHAYYKQQNEDFSSCSIQNHLHPVFCSCMGCGKIGWLYSYLRICPMKKCIEKQSHETSKCTHCNLMRAVKSVDQHATQWTPAIQRKLVAAFPNGLDVVEDSPDVDIVDLDTDDAPTAAKASVHPRAGTSGKSAAASAAASANVTAYKCRKCLWEKPAPNATCKNTECPSHNIGRGKIQSATENDADAVSAAVSAASGAGAVDPSRLQQPIDNEGGAGTVTVVAKVTTAGEGEGNGITTSGTTGIDQDPLKDPYAQTLERDIEELGKVIKWNEATHKNDAFDLKSAQEQATKFKEIMLLRNQEIEALRDEKQNNHEAYQGHDETKARLQNRITELKAQAESIQAQIMDVAKQIELNDREYSTIPDKQAKLTQDIHKKAEEMKDAEHNLSIQVKITDYLQQKLTASKNKLEAEHQEYRDLQHRRDNHLLQPDAKRMRTTP